MTRNLMAAGVLLAGLSVASAQTITPGIGGVAVTGQSGAGVYIPWNGGGAVIGAPGVGSYNLQGGVYTSPYSWNQFSNPTAYNFNTGSFNYNSGVYQSGYYSPYSGSYYSGYSGYPYSSGVYQTGYYSPYTSGWGGSSYGTSFGGRVSTPVIYTNGGGRGRGRWR